jgi:SAM-dependent methyltransferase
MKETLVQAAKHWSAAHNPGRTRWWNSPKVVRHINRLVCGEAIDGLSAGVMRRMQQLVGTSPIGRGISVGCGNGWKEMQLVREGVVQGFDLFEISATRAEQGRKLAREQGLADRVSFQVADAFGEPRHSVYDLVYWNNALHHMLDVEQALSWSRDCLRDGGHLVMDDFVGRTRFQWSDLNLEVASRVRALLPKEYLRHPNDRSHFLSTQVRRPDPALMIQSDPTEAADSDRIVETLRRFFPNAEVILTGGCVYHLGLNDVLANIDEEADLPLLGSLLLLDETLAKMGETHYAVAFATKNTPTIE